MQVFLYYNETRMIILNRKQYTRAPNLGQRLSYTTTTSSVLGTASPLFWFHYPISVALVTTSISLQFTVYCASTPRAVKKTASLVNPSYFFNILKTCIPVICTQQCCSINIDAYRWVLPNSSLEGFSKKNPWKMLCSNLASIYVC